jgi:DNA-directed RNA polymerase specialized sigma24 family protein
MGLPRGSRMSNALSIATVTAVIKNLLENGLVSDAIATSVGDVLVTALPPDKIQVGSDERAQINLFLYHVTQNRNVDWISQEYRSRHSVINTRTTNPPLALDLHYVLTAYGAKDFQAEILLGYAMQLLHKLPVLASETIENALKNAAETSTASVFSQAIAGLSVSELANKLGQIKVSPAFLNMEETTRIWSALQTNYRPSATYQASMVLIDSENTDKLNDSNSLPSEPTIEQITAPSSQTETNITVGSTLLIRGKQLRGDITKVRLGNIDKLFAPFDIQDTQISLQIPPELRAGVQSVQIVHEKMRNTEIIESNVMPFVLHPKINVVETRLIASLQDGQSYSAEISIKLIPKVNKNQRITVQLNQISKTDPATYSSMVPTPTEDTDTITIPFKNIKPGEYLVRVKIDGAESMLNKNQSGEYDSPRIAIK